MPDIANRKLLVMGGKPVATADILSYARHQGAHTIVTDYLPRHLSPGKLLADEDWPLSTADVDAIVDRCRREGVNGVIAGAHEFNVERALDVAERLELPFYATRAQLELSCDKARFKRLCRDFDIPVVKDYGLISDASTVNPERLHFPVILKPADNSGGRGITICREAAGFTAACSRATSFSASRRVLVERLMRCPEVTIFYAMRNGNICLTAMADRHVRSFQDGVIALPVAYVFPSRHLPGYRETLDRKVKMMFESIGIRDGMIFIQSFIENGECVFYEMGYRLTGTLEYHLIDRVCGFNPMHMMVNYALTGDAGCERLAELANPDFRSWCCNVTFLAKPGIIGRIMGLKEIAAWPEIVAVVPSYAPGEVIEQSAIGTLKQVVARVFAVAPSRPKLFDVMKRIQHTVRVESDDGRNLLLPPYDFSDG